jgi:hypothetical protein
VSVDENIGDFQHDMTCLEVSYIGLLRMHQLFTTQTLDLTTSGSVMNETGTETGKPTLLTGARVRHLEILHKH